MLIGYARVSKADGSQSLDLQHDALRAAGVERDNIYDDLASGGRDDRPGLTACLKSLRDGDVLVVWKLDRLGRSLAHLVNTVKELSDRKIGLRVLTGKGAQIDTTTASGRMVFGIFATLAEFIDRNLNPQKTKKAPQNGCFFNTPCAPYERKRLLNRMTLIDTGYEWRFFAPFPVKWTQLPL